MVFIQYNVSMKKRFNVFVVDDDFSSALLLKELLTLNNIKVRVETNSKIALNIIEEESFDLIITDIVMKDVSGFDILKQIRKKKCKTTIWAVSAHVMGNVQTQCTNDYGFDRFISKPYDIDILLEDIKKIISIPHLQLS